MIELIQVAIEIAIHAVAILIAAGVVLAAFISLVLRWIISASR